jgi:hypothetical protein
LVANTRGKNLNTCFTKDKGRRAALQRDHFHDIALRLSVNDFLYITTDCVKFSLSVVQSFFGSYRHRAGGIDQAVEHLPSIRKDLGPISSTTTTTKKKKKRKKETKTLQTQSVNNALRQSSGFN